MCNLLKNMCFCWSTLLVGALSTSSGGVLTNCFQLIACCQRWHSRLMRFGQTPPGCQLLAVNLKVSLEHFARLMSQYQAHWVWIQHSYLIATDGTFRRCNAAWFTDDCMSGTAFCLLLFTATLSLQLLVGHYKQMVRLWAYG